MRRKRLLWQLYSTYLAVVLMALLAIALYSWNALRDFCVRQTRSDLSERAALLEPEAARLLESGDLSRMDSWAKELGRKASTRITLVLPSGKVVADSEEDPDQMANHGRRSEIVDAMARGSGLSVRFSGTLHTDMMYVAVPLYGEEGLLGVLRVSIPLWSVRAALKSVRLRMVIGGLMVAAAAALVSFAVYRRIASPIEEMRKGAERFARGDLKARLPRLPVSLEVGGLVDALNQMAGALDDRIRTITQQRNEIQAILSGMIEGVIAVDTDERIITLNRAAAMMLGVTPDGSIGRLIQEATRNREIQKFVERTLSSSAPVEADIVLHLGEERFLQAHGTLLHDTEMRKVGGVVVLNDITRLRRLEGVRREFVANVSHELRTPITAIKGFAEALADGALENRADAERFLRVIVKQADRLNTMIEDLLMLSSIEQKTQTGDIALTEACVAEVLESAATICGLKASKRKVKIAVRCQDDLTARINVPLLEQAVVNLLDNAIKHSEEGGLVEVEAVNRDSDIIVRVTDHGCGIEKEHLPRLFERFYRVDKARSQKSGGTGLGLAIVKHITEAHVGSVEVESTPGKGSVFTIHLPKP